MKRPVLTVLLALASGLPGANASPLPEGPVPLPFIRPDDPVEAVFPTPEITGAIPRTATPDASLSQLKTALDALSARDVATALAVRNSLPDGSLDRHLLTGRS